MVGGDEDLLRGFSQRGAKLELGCVALGRLELVSCMPCTTASAVKDGTGQKCDYNGKFS